MDIEKNRIYGYPYETGLNNNISVQLRLLSSDNKDKAHLVKGFKMLSEKSRYFRFMSPTPYLSDKMLNHLTQIDNQNHLAICVRSLENNDGIAIGRIIRQKAENHVAEFAITVVDKYQNLGLGNLLFDHLVLAARKNGIEVLRGFFFENNDAMIKMMRRRKAKIKWEFGAVLQADFDIALCQTENYSSTLL